MKSNLGEATCVRKIVLMQENDQMWGISLIIGISWYGFPMFGIMGNPNMQYKSKIIKCIRFEK